MKVFISWSGHQSKAVALALREFIPDLIQSARPWMSNVDIEAGERWSKAVFEELHETSFGIICLTRENLTAPWIQFEAGALAKAMEKTHVCPYLVGMDPADIPNGPLTQFQAKRANKDETKQMMAALNKSMGDNGLDESQFNRAFDRCWPELEVKLENIPSANSPASDQRSTDDLVREILVLVRELVRQNDSVLTIKKNLTDALYPLKSKEDAAMEALGIKRRRRAPISSEKGNPDSGLKL